MAEEEFLEEEEGSKFQEAVEALREGDNARARDLLTKLLKSEQDNAQYWIWLSATVESTKEKIYCLQTALQLDPENATAKRGLVLLGALPPDESVQPFSLNRPRLWEEDLKLATEKPKEKRTFKSVITSPVGRLAGFGLIGIAVIAAVVFGLILPNNNRFSPRAANTAGPSPTYTLTPTFINATAQAPEARGTLIPLAELLDAPLTPTPLYVNTPPDPISGDMYRVALRAYEQGDWDTVIDSMLQIAENEPEAAYPYYYIGEAYRFKGDYNQAFSAYNRALEIDNEFGPAFLGLARASLLRDPDANIEYLYEEAIRHDPNFGEIYLDRALYYLDRQEPRQALSDLATAERLLPGSPLVFYNQARANLELDNLEEAEEAAFKANQADPTMLPVYLILGEIYTAQGEYADAIEVLQTYAKYETNDPVPRALLGAAYYEAGDCESAIEAYEIAISMDSNLRQAYLHRGLCYLQEGELELADDDLERALQYYPDDFELNLSVMQIRMQQGFTGDAYLQGEKVLSLAETNEELALAYYWRAINFEDRDEPENAADSWQELLELPVSAMPRQMRAEAQERFYELRTVTPSPTATSTRTASNTPTPSRTLTPTRTPTITRTPTRTLSPTSTRTPTFTRTPTPSN
jgi:tetratricopeptide (TPR) repeat protein